MNIIDAVSIRGQTMICPDREFPHKRGNCFSVAGADGKNYTPDQRHDAAGA